jgi:type IV pilus assembly protein PilN
MIKINLLSEGKRPAAVRKAKTTSLLEGKDIGLYLLGLGLVLGLVASLSYWWTIKGQVDAQQDDIKVAQAEVDSLGAVIKEVEDYKGKKAELERKIGIINDLKANQRGPVRLMDYVSRALPELLWLDRMSMNASTIEIEGRAFNTNAVATFIENLDKVPEFEEPTLKDTSEQAGGVYKFTISFNYSFTPPKTEGTGNAATPSVSGPAASARPTSG